MNAKIESDDLLGYRLGTWILEKKLGKGGMAIVYQGQHNLLPKKAAIKLLLPKFSQDRDTIKRFKQEAIAVNELQHKNIVQLSDFAYDQNSSCYYMVQELLEGHDLSKIIDTAPFPKDWNLLVAQQLCSALSEIHKAGLIHRDLKPSNIFILDDNGSPLIKILDFGIAKLQKEKLEEIKSKIPSTTSANDLKVIGQLTDEIELLGTPSYLAPEQAAKTGQLSHKADIYALGVLLYQLFTGKLPLGGNTPFEQFMAVMMHTPMPAGLHREALKGTQLEQFFSKVLSKSPDMRPESMDHMWLELQEAASYFNDPLEATIGFGQKGMTLPLVDARQLNTPSAINSNLPTGSLSSDSGTVEMVNYADNGSTDSSSTLDTPGFIPDGAKTIDLSDALQGVDSSEWDDPTDVVSSTDQNALVASLKKSISYEDDEKTIESSGQIKSKLQAMLEEQGISQDINTLIPSLQTADTSEENAFNDTRQEHTAGAGYTKTSYVITTLAVLSLVLGFFGWRMISPPLEVTALDLLIKEAKEYQNQKKYPQAISTWKSIIKSPGWKKSRHYPNLYKELARLFTQQQQLYAALLYYKRYLKAKGRNASHLPKLLKTENQLGLQAQLRQNRATALRTLTLFKKQCDTEKWDAARDNFLQLKQLVPSVPMLHHRLAQLLATKLPLAAYKHYDYIYSRTEYSPKEYIVLNTQKKALHRLLQSRKGRVKKHFRQARQKLMKGEGKDLFQWLVLKIGGASPWTLPSTHKQMSQLLHISIQQDLPQTIRLLEGYRDLMKDLKQKQLFAWLSPPLQKRIKKSRFSLQIKYIEETKQIQKMLKSAKKAARRRRRSRLKALSVKLQKRTTVLKSKDQWGYNNSLQKMFLDISKL